jgi:hypothetical protein
MTDDTEKARRAAVKEATLRSMALFVLLERAGGGVAFTDEEYQAALARVGGSKNAAIHIEIVGSKGEPAQVQLTLISKPPANAELLA